VNIGHEVIEVAIAHFGRDFDVKSFPNAFSTWSKIDLAEQSGALRRLSELPNKFLHGFLIHATAAIEKAAPDYLAGVA